MENYGKSRHTVYDITYHIAWITKYRKLILMADIAQKMRVLIRERCRSNITGIIKRHLSHDHVQSVVIEQQSLVPPHVDLKPTMIFSRLPADAKTIGPSRYVICAG